MSGGQFRYNAILPANSMQLQFRFKQQAAAGHTKLINWLQIPCLAQSCLRRHPNLSVGQYQLLLCLQLNCNGMVCVGECGHTVLAACGMSFM